MKVSTMLELLQNFRELTEVGLNVDTAPVIPVQESVVFYSGQGHCSLSNITRLTLEVIEII
ncbi:unnamed protein product [Arabidopsis lyrata]|uniref:Uncharacterized protein n=1 Tax=Arabidopsis lyrata subsp. lyrata TaxID=81972 RepID=D7LKC3_ARALL|nr:hypothetical protein ARALYDRAFT_902916 [Arabidopsis lyrata subsp. lyrata]EFH57797.1 hypothetical protein ARALYDRAFT_902936 [Arabidopsis lyrata subsp. lyrata]CAH8265080.1 unnamed protein product [Arabidopsis lyrata]